MNPTQVVVEGTLKPDESLEVAETLGPPSRQGRAEIGRDRTRPDEGGDRLLDQRKAVRVGSAAIGSGAATSLVFGFSPKAPRTRQNIRVTPFLLLPPFPAVLVPSLVVAQSPMAGPASRRFSKSGSAVRVTSRRCPTNRPDSA